MRLSKWSYRADFAVYPVLVAISASLAVAHATRAQSEAGMVAMVVGVLVWTLIEYVLHRWVLHGLQPFRRLHDAHHASPFDFIGTPTWLSVALFMVLWGILAEQAPRAVAGGFVAGLMFGYLVYTLLHDALHHRRARSGSWLHRAKLRHARHHLPGAHTDFGVSTDLWDRLFDTDARTVR